MADRFFDLAIFDFDGTLVSSHEGIHACMSEALRRFGYPQPTIDDLKSTIGLPLEESISILTRSRCPTTDLAEIVSTYRHLHADQAAPRTQLFPGARGVIESAVRAGVACVLVSNKGRAGLAQLLEQLQIASFFTLVLSADDVRHRKPATALFELHIAPKFPDVPLDRTLVIGDTEVDLTFAMNISVAGCWAAYGYGDHSKCGRVSSHRIDDISQLSSILFRP